MIAGNHGPRPPSHPMPGVRFLHCLLGGGCDWGRGACIHSSRPQLQKKNLEERLADARLVVQPACLSPDQGAASFWIMTSGP